MVETATTSLKRKSRAVLRRVEAGNTAICAHCDQTVKFTAKIVRQQVIANVYVNGRWDRVEHFHAECYAEGAAPYGDASGGP